MENFELIHMALDGVEDHLTGAVKRLGQELVLGSEVGDILQEVSKAISLNENVRDRVHEYQSRSIHNADAQKGTHEACTPARHDVGNPDPTPVQQESSPKQPAPPSASVENGASGRTPVRDPLDSETREDLVRLEEAFLEIAAGIPWFRRFLEPQDETLTCSMEAVLEGQSILHRLLGRCFNPDYVCGPDIDTSDHETTPTPKKNSHERTQGGRA